MCISRQVLYGSLVFDELCAAEVDGRYWFSLIVFNLKVLIKVFFIPKIAQLFP